MFALPHLVSETSPEAVVAFVDGVLLTAVLSPLLWLLIVGPLSKIAAMRRELLGAALTAQEDERRRIARECTTAWGRGLRRCLSVSARLRRCRKTKRFRNVARDLRRIGGEAHDEVRRMARGLRPAVLDDVGMVPALGAVLERCAADARCSRLANRRMR